MLAKAVVKAIMGSKSIGPSKMAEMLGCIRQTISDRLGTGKSVSMGTDKLDEMVRVLGYKVIVVPQEVEMKDGWYEIDDSKQELTPEIIKERKRERLMKSDPTLGDAQ